MTVPSEAPATDPDTLTTTLAEFASVFADSMLADSLGRQLTCVEADTLAATLRALGDSDAATMWIEFHAHGDEPGDRHHRIT